MTLWLNKKHQVKQSTKENNMMIAAYHVTLTNNTYLGVANGDNEIAVYEDIVRQMATDFKPEDGTILDIFVFVDGETEETGFEVSERLEAILNANYVVNVGDE
jgi:hypothetical protein